MRPIYMDYAATTPVRPEVLEIMTPYFSDLFGNPSSLHSFGREARAALIEARGGVAAAFGVTPEEIYFTSGGTESDNAAIKGVAYANRNKGKHIITSRVEHPAIISTCKFLKKEGFEITYLPVDAAGVVDPEDVRRALRKDTVLVTIMFANNEVGTIEPIEEIGLIAAEAGVYFHTDAVQAVGSVPIDLSRLKVDLLSSSAHKFYGPKGVGILFMRKGTRFVPLMHGGEQENRRRAGTENVAGAVGYAAALRLALEEMDERNARLISMRDRLIAGITERIKYSRLNGHPTRRLPNNINVTIDYIEGESMLLNLDLKGIAASTGSACSSGSLEPSHVLLAMGCKHEEAHGSLRFTLGRHNTDEDVDYVLDVLPEIVAKLRAMSPLYEG
ncbi:MAG: cysteine desulfurase NifS [bacterium]|jgi:cysteine desulfurase|nr:cysteine desulfurase NifS [bacterium]MDD3805006.1 cysteine desulfurase NifS [bacterium]MDD4153602.1 cysteine desulfurase NifS [bacterium]MDD4557674.1 cysteine desulfurase NifS [bacterium]